MTANPEANPVKSVFTLLLISTAALADDAAILRCRAIADPSARLACYDALPLPTPESKAEARPVVPQPTGESKAPPAAGTAGTPTAEQAPTPQVGALPQEPQAQFGLPKKAIEVPLEAIESRIPGHFEGWGPNSRIRLANGQVWRVDDDSSRVCDLTDPKVTIRRGLLGAYYLEFEAFNQTARVKRLQ